MGTPRKRPRKPLPDWKRKLIDERKAVRALDGWRKPLVEKLLIEQHNEYIRRRNGTEEIPFQRSR